jgi:hypothetical protein
MPFEHVLDGNILSIAFLILTFFSPFISLVTDTKLLEYVRSIKSKGYVYVLALFIAFVLARTFYLLFSEMISIGITKQYSYPSAIVDFVFFLSSLSYWYVTSKLLKVEDKAMLLTIMYVAESFWLIFVFTIVCGILNIFIK